MRTTPTELRKIIDDTTLTDNVLESFITSASLFVDNTLVDKGLTPQTLTDIERWISAHLVSYTRERQSKEEGAGGAYIKYAGEFGEGLKATSYGQMAILLDTSGTLASMAGGTGKSINITAL